MTSHCACDLPAVPEGDTVDVSSKKHSAAMHEHAMAPPSPRPTRVTRRDSVSERAMAGPTEEGKIKWFCRQRGHGFIAPKKGGDDLFVHILDIEGEFAPHDGDEVTYKECLLPPKFESLQAVHVVIRNLAPGVRHERWCEPPQPHAHPHPTPNTPDHRAGLLTSEELKELQHK